MSFRIRLNEIIEQRHMTMSLLSHLSMVDFKTVKEICRNPQRNTTIETLTRLALALEVTMDDLIEITSDDSSSQE